MKRHPSLAPLSRQHHGALILAQLLKKNAAVYKGMPNDPGGKAIYAAGFYDNDLLPHFEAEEKLFEKLKGIHAALDKEIKEIIEEHVLLRKLFTCIKDQADMPAYLDVLGHTLEKHIRREDRILFPLIEEVADEAMLLSIAQLINQG
jgi:iron-sulfur cluster repair protein YtfE (RIC family)